jgi:hypothetical protein
MITNQHIFKAKDIRNKTLNNENKISDTFPIKSEYHSFTIDHKPQNSTQLVLVLRHDYSFKRFNIRGFENFIFITFFWWQKTETYYFVAENREHLYNGFIYRLDPKNGDIISTVSRNKSFFY